ncbi:MAG: DMT family transporter [Rhodospirillales bacterium]|nr:DMT family transporter [Rhodospirillales bacterium]
MELWIPITIVAAFCQNLRSALQKHLKGKLTTGGATYVRFFYAWPFALLYVWGLHSWGDMPIPEIKGNFLLYCLLGGLSQIIFTGLLVWLFSFRNFAVGTTFSKTETVQVALLGFLLLGDTLSTGALLAIIISVIGVMAMSLAQTNITFKTLFAGLIEKSTLIGLASGLFLGGSVVFFRGASLELHYDGFLMSAAFTLAVSVVIQTVLMGAYLLWREPDQIKAILVNWKWSLAVGVAGVLGSVAWFSAFTLENAALVRAVGQIELVFTFIASTVFFHEKSTKLEMLGILLVIAGILLILFVR